VDTPWESKEADRREIAERKRESEKQAGANRHSKNMAKLH